MSGEKRASGKLDMLTLIAVAIIAYAIANIAHEGVGHGGTCLIVGGRVVELNAMYLDCDESGLARASMRWISADGTLMNLVIGALSWAGLRSLGRGVEGSGAPKATLGRYFLWLLMTVSLLQGTGYWLFSGIGNVGDWAKIIEGLSPAWPWRVLLAVIGGVGYALSIGLSLREIRYFIGAGEERVARARTLMLVPYITGAALYIAAGLLNPIGFVILLISSAAASLGGTSGLFWAYNMLHDRRRLPPVDAPPLEIRRSIPLIGAALAVALVFIVILGRSLHF